MEAGWPDQSLQGMIIDSLDDPLATQATPEEREGFDRGEPLSLGIRFRPDCTTKKSSCASMAMAR
jgi:hypothetical protein